MADDQCRFVDQYDVVVIQNDPRAEFGFRDFPAPFSNWHMVFRGWSLSELKGLDLSRKVLFSSIKKNGFRSEKDCKIRLFVLF
jgi:hypothetical protein